MTLPCATGPGLRFMNPSAALSRKSGAAASTPTTWSRKGYLLWPFVYLVVRNFSR
jgi:hypothetical protein